MVCLFHIGSVAGIWFPPSTPQGRRRKPWPMAGDCAICGWRWERLGDFAPCAARPKALPLETAIWAVRRPLARVVGERFFVRTRCAFAAILYVWQETAAQSWRKRPGEHRRHTGGGQPSQEKNRVKLLFWGFQIVAISYWGISLESTSVKYSGSSQRTVTGSSVRGCRNVNSRAWRHWLSMPSSGFLWP